VTLCSLVEVSEKYCLHLQGQRVSYANESASIISVGFLVAWLTVRPLKREAARYSETSVNFYWTAWHNIAEDSNLHISAYPMMHYLITISIIGEESKTLKSRLSTFYLYIYMRMFVGMFVGIFICIIQD
jgi:hypothetical protein